MRNINYSFINFIAICRCIFTTNDLCLEWHKRLSRAIVSPKNVQDVFAFAFHAWAIEDQCNDEISSNFGHDGDDDYFMKDVMQNNLQHFFKLN